MILEGHARADGEGTVLEADAEFAVLLGVDPVGKRLEAWLDRNSWSQVSEALTRAVHAPFESSEFDVRLRYAGDQPWIHLQLTPSSTKGVAMVGVVPVAPPDLAAEDQARSWRQELSLRAQADRQDPVAPLIEGLRALRAGLWGPVGTEMRERVAGLEVFAQRMEVLLDEVRCAAAVARGEFRVERSHLDLRAVVHEACAAFRDAADDEGIEFHVRAQTPMPCLLDRGRILHVLETLLENALRFTPAGGAVHVQARPTDAGYEVSVRDEGPGLDPAQQAAIWEPFASVHGSSDGQGVGLGLFVAQHAMRAHGGTLRVESSRGQGCRFTLFLPP